MCNSLQYRHDFLLLSTEIVQQNISLNCCFLQNKMEQKRGGSAENSACSEVVLVNEWSSLFPSVILVRVGLELGWITVHIEMTLSVC